MPNRAPCAAAPNPLRRDILLGVSALTGLRGAAPAALLAACGGGNSAPTAGTVSPEPTVPPASSSPALGAHGLVYNRDGVARAPLHTAALGTRTAGSRGSFVATHPLVKFVAA